MAVLTFQVFSPGISFLLVQSLVPGMSTRSVLIPTSLLFLSFSLLAQIFTKLTLSLASFPTLVLLLSVSALQTYVYFLLRLVQSIHYYLAMYRMSFSVVHLQDDSMSIYI